MTKDFFFRSKDIMTIILFTLFGLGAFIVYLSYFTTVMLWVALAYLTFTLFRRRSDGEGDSENPVYGSHFGSPNNIDDFRIRLSQV